MMRQESKSHSPGPHELENMQHNAVQDGASNPTSSAATANTQLTSNNARTWQL